ncbi:MAG: hypothetical protein M3Z20_07820 [Chloroflexota bacterium]|nr:hypothetical protein [Chloroflexota bacterium]
MTERTFDTLTRRASLLGLGVGIAAFSSPLTAGAKKNKNKKIKKKAKKKCQDQIPQCQAEIIALCQGNQSCLDAELPCCPTLADCNLIAFFGCLAGS